MSTIHWVGGEKGGVGKSVVSRLLAQYFLDRGLGFVAIDADSSHGAMLRYYREYTHGVDLESFSSADQIMDRALGAERRVLVDLPAQSARQLQRWMEAGDVMSFAQQMDVRLVFWHVTDGGYDSVGQLAAMLELFGDTLSHVVVKNYGRSAEFSQLDESDALRALRDVGGKVIEIPQLDGATMYKLDRFGSSFWAAVNASEGDWALSPMARRRTQHWLERAYAGLEQAGDWL